jgi:hypothetical protein
MLAKSAPGVYINSIGHSRKNAYKGWEKIQHPELLSVALHERTEEHSTGTNRREEKPKCGFYPK